MSTAVTHWVVDKRLGKALAKAVLYFLAHIADDDGCFTCTFESLERTTDLTRSSTRQMLKWLEDGGWIVRYHGAELAGRILVSDVSSGGSPSSAKLRGR
jgi:DNA-binding MarR family transcriptional regulator